MPCFPDSWCRASRADPPPSAGLREQFRPERMFRGRHNAKLRYAVLAAAALHGGTEPDLLDEVACWQTGDFWLYALVAAVAHIRAAASRTGVPVRQACQNLAQRPGHQRHNHQFGTQQECQLRSAIGVEPVLGRIECGERPRDAARDREPGLRAPGRVRTGLGRRNVPQRGYL
jgi:hypothetical protein